jgi:hypothetical protein
MRVTVSPEQIQSAFEAVKDDPSFDESRGLWERGRPPVEMIQAMCLRPEILRGFAGFGGSVYPGGLLERRVKELVVITSSKVNECQFCTNSHCDLVDIWVKDGVGDLSAGHPGGYVQTAEQITGNLDADLAGLNRIADTIYTRWTAGLRP